MNQDLLPSVPEILNNPACSTWLRSTLQAALFGSRDPTQAARDARLLADVLQARAEAGRSSPGFVYFDGRRQPEVDVPLPLTDSDSQPLSSFGRPLANAVATDPAPRR